MKRYENARITLFDSSNAYFKLAVEAQFTRKNPDGSYRDLVYTTDKGTSVMNPNIYLTLAYKDDSTNAVYTSYPQLYRLRKALEIIKDYLENDDAFIYDENDASLSVKQNYSEPVIIDNIGKNNNWISLKLCVIKTGENGVFNYSKGVNLELSTSNGWASALSQEEFLTVYTIIKDLNLTNLQCMLSLGFLNGEQRTNVGYTAPAYNNYNGYNNTAPYGSITTTPAYVAAPQQNYQGYQNQQPQQTNYMKPRYNNQTRTPSYRNVVPSTNAAPQNNNYIQQTPQNNVSEYTSPIPGNVLPPRGNNKPVMNMKAVEDTPISSYDIDDTEALNAIFDGE